MAPPYPADAAQKMMPTAVRESKPIVKQHASTKGTNARNSSKLPQKAEPHPNIIMQIGIIRSSLPLVFLITLAIPALIAPVASIIAKVPPIISRKKII